MSESVTGGLPFGDIPADTEMFTAEQTVSKIASLQTILSGLTEEGWSGLDNIISGIDSVTATFATKAELASSIDARITPINGDLLLACGVDSGEGVSGVYYWQHRSSGPSAAVKLLDETMISGGVDRLQEVVHYAGGISDTGMRSDELVTKAGNAFDALAAMRIVAPFCSCGAGPGSGFEHVSGILDSLYEAVSGNADAIGLLSGFISNYTAEYSYLRDGITAIANAFAAWSDTSGRQGSPVLIPSGTTLCDAIDGCVGGRIESVEATLALMSVTVTSLESNMSAVAGCCAQVEALSGCCKQASTGLEALAGLLDNLETAIYSLQAAVSGMYDDIGDAIIDALTSEPLEAVFDDPDADEDIKKRIDKARGKVNIPPVPPLPPGGGPRPPVPLPDPKDVADVVKPDLPDNPASGLVEPLEDIKDILDNRDTSETDSVSEAAETAGGGSSGGEDASSAAESAASAAGDVAGSFIGE